MVYLTRKAEFSASHYYHNPEFTPEENQRIFGKCNNPNGHGHNYTLEVTVKGNVDQRSGFVVDLKELKENLAISIWRRLEPKLSLAELHRVRVYETPDLFVDFYGEA
jgi:6-pyruvoyltetrahydropterin/6-carboxytetrahydropterin synthase